MLDLLVTDATLIDGTGAPARPADVGIKDGRVVVVGHDLTHEAERTIDATRLVLTPGFIDVHTHSDFNLLQNPRAESKIRQGVTTEVIGNCGFSPAPLHGPARQQAEAEIAELELTITWEDVAGYLERLEAGGSAVNVVPLVGHGMVRASAMGVEDRPATSEELTTMERLVAQAMEQGAWGLSTGLIYPPGCYAPTDEIVALARLTKRCGGVYTSHIRGEAETCITAVREALYIAEKAGVPAEISHLKLVGHQNWGDLDALFTVLDEGQQRGIDFECDQYPYTASSTWLAACLPEWVYVGGFEAMAERLEDPAVRRRIHDDVQGERGTGSYRNGAPDWSGVLITQYPPQPELRGRTLADVAAEQSKHPLDTVMDLLIASEGVGSAMFFNQSEDVVQAILRHPSVTVGSDGSSIAPYGVFATWHPHPRNYGTFPRVLGRYVRDLGLLSLEEAVHKMTGKPAARFNLTNRGVIREGAWADLVLFDPTTIADQATYAEPHQYAVGIPCVIVNGVITVEKSEHTGVLAGRVLRRVA